MQSLPEDVKVKQPEEAESQPSPQCGSCFGLTADGNARVVQRESINGTRHLVEHTCGTSMYGRRHNFDLQTRKRAAVGRKYGREEARLSRRRQRIHGLETVAFCRKT